MDEQREKRHSAVYRFFTGARRIPLMVGRTATGERLWGGPYRITQMVVAGVALFVLYVSYQLGIWGGGNLLIDGATGAVIVAALGYLSGKLPVTKRSAWSMLRSGYRAFTAPPGGQYRHQEVQIRKPHSRYRVHGPSTVSSLATAPIPAEPAPEAKPAFAPAPAPVETAVVIDPPRAVTALDALMAQIK